MSYSIFQSAVAVNQLSFLGFKIEKERGELLYKYF